MVTLANVVRTGKRKLWCVLFAVVFVMVAEVAALNGPNVCMVKQKYNITKRVKYRAPVSVRTYVWCYAMPPRCSNWSTEMRDLTRLETEERTAEVAVCCPGFKMKDVSCVPICPNGRTGSGCSDACPTSKWGPNCVNSCGQCEHGSCSPITGECRCRDGWKGESCEISMPPITISTLKVEVLTINPATISSIRSTTTTPAATSTALTTVETKTTHKTKTTEMPTKISVSTKSTTNYKLLEANDTENITKIRNNFKPENQISLTTIETSRNETFIEGSTMPTLNTFTSKYNRTEVPSTVNGIEVTIVNFDLKRTTTESITEKIKSLTPSQRNESINESEIIRESTQIDDGKNVIITEENTTSRQANSSPVPPTALVDFISTANYFTDETQSKITPIDKELGSIVPIAIEDTIKPKKTQNLETTTKTAATTKFKYKEIWIKPALKTETIEPKKVNHDMTKHKISTNLDFTITTTPKTIIVSIIPTSVSYVTFKKIALTTASYLTEKKNTTIGSYNKSTKPLIKPKPSISLPSSTTKSGFQATSTFNSTPSTVYTNKPNKASKALTTKTFLKSELAYINSSVVSSSTNMVEKHMFDVLNTSELSTNTYADSKMITKKMTLYNNIMESTTPTTKTERPHKYYITAKHRNLTRKITTTHKPKDEKTTQLRKDNPITLTTNINKVTTEDPSDEDVLHILTEPEHITAVMEEKERRRTSMDLVSVVSIAGGIMMAVITVAVIIVMVERCKRPRYENVRKINDIHMQVMIDSNDPPPPYVRSIFHTPLPDPPITEICHYQPISTLDRNLKQFMRPVVVQTISPIMLENFRGILECHYDHLPRRSHDFTSLEACCTLTPSMSKGSGLRCTHTDIEAMKREAKMDIIDATTSEPLYAEIPCWRPPSAHATEIINHNGEAVTEL